MALALADSKQRALLRFWFRRKSPTTYWPPEIALYDAHEVDALVEAKLLERSPHTNYVRLTTAGVNEARKLLGEIQEGGDDATVSVE